MNPGIFQLRQTAYTPTIDAMRIDSTPYRRFAILAAAGTIALAACGSDSTADSPATTTTTTLVGAAAGASESETTLAPTSTAVSDSVPPVTEAPATAPPETAALDEATSTTDPPNPGDCLVGIWELRSQEFLDELTTTFGDGVPTDWQHVGGVYLVTINADGTYLGERDAWQFRIATPEGAIVTTTTSSDPGTYEVDENIITFNDLPSEATVKLQLESGGTLVDLPIGGTQTVDTDSLSGAGEFTCIGDILTTALVDEAYPDGVKATFDRTTS